MLKPLIRQIAIAEACQMVNVPDKDKEEALDAFANKYGLDTEEKKEAFLRSNLLTRDDLIQQLIDPLRANIYARENFLVKAEARFLKKKEQLDRVIYSLLRLEDGGLARELYLRISEGESDFAQLAESYAEGPERATRGVVGPVPLTQAHPVLAERLRTATPGILMEPFRIEKWWLVARLEVYSPAIFDDEMAFQMAQEAFDESIDSIVLQRISELSHVRFSQR